MYRCKITNNIIFFQPKTIMVTKFGLKKHWKIHVQVRLIGRITMVPLLQDHLTLVLTPYQQGLKISNLDIGIRNTNLKGVDNAIIVRPHDFEKMHNSMLTPTVVTKSG